jgi:heme/copper-type cytochrome/quinol oxidase subunit 2
VVSRGGAAAAALAVSLLGGATAASACPVCFAADAQAVWFYRLSTVLLSLLPFAVVGSLVGVGFLLRRRA